MSDDGTISWGDAVDETAGASVGRPQARWMCEVAVGLDGDEFLDVLDEPATERVVAHLDAMLARLGAGEPLQYVLGRWGFRHLDLMVDRRVLIPRPETEMVVERRPRTCHGRCRRRSSCADLGTGSGAIGLSLAAELPVDGVTVWMTDASHDALDVARANARRHRAGGRPTCASRGRLVRRAAGRRCAVVWRWSWRTRRTSPTTIPSSSRSCAMGAGRGAVRRRRRARRDPRTSSPSAAAWLRPADGWCSRSASSQGERVDRAAARRRLRRRRDRPRSRRPRSRRRSARRAG